MARPRLLVSWLWMASAGAWHVEDLRDALQRFLDDRAGPYAASLAVVGDGYEVAVAAGARPGDASRRSCSAGRRSLRSVKPSRRRWMTV